MFSMIRRPRSLALLTCIFALSSMQAMAIDKPPFPRVAANLIGGSRNYEASAVQDKLSKFDVVLLNIWPTWEAGRGTTLDTVARNIKSRKSDTGPLIFLYNNINEEEVPTPKVMRDVDSAINSNGWWLTTSGTSGSRVKSTWGDNFYILNTTTYARRNSNGDRYIDWRAKWQVNTFIKPNPSIDGFITDNVFWKPRVNGDWNMDGSIDSQDSATVQGWFRQGYRSYIDDLKALMPGKYQGGNVADWGKSNSTYPELNGQLNLGFMEGLIGYSWSAEAWGGFAELMREYRKMLNSLAEPKLGLFAQIGSTSDYRSLRYGLAACLMDDGYFLFNSSASYNDTPWFDEYDSNLGASTSGPATSAWQKGVYRRDFENGIALVNPKGNGTQTVTLETTYRKLSGSQAPNINDGSTVQSVTLNDRDGIILLRLSAQTQAKPAAPKSIVVQ